AKKISHLRRRTMSLMAALCLAQYLASLPLISGDSRSSAMAKPKASKKTEPARPTMDMQSMPDMDMKANPGMDMKTMPGMDMKAMPNMDMKSMPGMNMNMNMTGTTPDTVEKMPAMDDMPPLRGAASVNPEPAAIDSDSQPDPALPRLSLADLQKL